jgi:hypothetical protein
MHITHEERPTQFEILPDSYTSREFFSLSLLLLSPLKSLPLNKKKGRGKTQNLTLARPTTSWLLAHEWLMMVLDVDLMWL